MLSGNCTDALSIQANVMISSSSATIIKNGIAPLPFPALLKQYWYIQRGERVRVRGHVLLYATLGFTLALGSVTLVRGAETPSTNPGYSIQQQGESAWLVK